MSNSESGNCLGMIIYLIISGTIGGMCIEYLSNTLLDKNLPMWADILIGFLGSSLTIPITVIVYILECCGVF